MSAPKVFHALSALAVLLTLAWEAAAAAPQSPLDDLLAALPQRAEDFSPEQAEPLEALAEAVDAWASELWWREGQLAEIVDTVGRLVAIKARVDAALEQTLDLRTRFSEQPDDDPRRERLRGYLRCTSALIDLSGRLRYRLTDVIRTAAYYLDPHPAEFNQLLDLLIRERVGAGAVVMAYMLMPSPPESGAPGYTPQEKYKALQLINAAQQADLIPALAEFIRREDNPSLVVIGAELLRRLGLPQDPRPQRDPTLPEPPIVAGELRQILLRSDPARLTTTLAGTRRELLAWLDQRIRHGILDDTYRLGPLELRAGDWLLMRNPSPYNRFTDLSPGLFTHVGVVAVEQGEDGIRRFVIVDLPERGSQVPATTVDIFLLRTLHYFFLRHEDPAVAQAMGAAAAAMIGNESQFDLTFQTRRVEDLQDQPLDDALIHTYCAGFLLICGQQAERPREEFFPIAELPAGGRTLDNLASLGLSIGEDFVSPTGAIFSPRLQIVGRREPMYDPAREVQEAIYDYFAEQIARQPLSPSPDARQAIREKLAALSKYSPWLARALAQAADVNQRMDLEAAARTATVVEILDEISEAGLNGFVAAWQAIHAGSLTPELRAQMTDEQREQIRSYQERHAELLAAWTAGQLNARQLRLELIAFYVQQGRRDVDARFFAAPAPAGSFEDSEPVTGDAAVPDS